MDLEVKQGTDKINSFAVYNDLGFMISLPGYEEKHAQCLKLFLELLEAGDINQVLRLHIDLTDNLARKVIQSNFGIR